MGRIMTGCGGLLIALSVVAAGCSRSPRAPEPPSGGAAAESQRPESDDAPGADLTALRREGLDTVRGTRSGRACCSATDSTQEIGGWTVGDSYGVEWLAVRGRQYLSFDSLTGRRDGRPLWQVVDAVWIPDHAESLRFVAGCASEAALRAGDSTADNAVMGIAVPEEGPYLTKVVFAWRADTLVRRFVVISPAALRCVNQGWGVD